MGLALSQISSFMDDYESITEYHNDTFRSYGLTYIQLYEWDDRVHIARIQSKITMRGHGSDALAILCHLADEYGKTLTVVANGEIFPTELLVEWYERFGYVVDKEQFDGRGIAMTRIPEN